MFSERVRATKHWLMNVNVMECYEYQDLLSKRVIDEILIRIFTVWPVGLAVSVWTRFTSETRKNSIGWRLCLVIEQTLIDSPVAGPERKIEGEWYFFQDFVYCMGLFPRFCPSLFAVVLHNSCHWAILHMLSAPLSFSVTAKTHRDTQRHHFYAR